MAIMGKRKDEKSTNTDKAGFFRDVADELKKRRIEEQESQSAIQREKLRIETKRANAKKSIIRKVGLIDKAYSKKEAKADAAELAAFEEHEKQRIAQQRSNRVREINRRNMPKYIITVIAIVAVLAAGGSFSLHKHNVRMQEQYDAGVQYILQEEYSEAYQALKGVSLNDAKALRSYAGLMKDLSSFKGKTNELSKELNAFDAFENDDINKQLAFVHEQVDLIAQVQALCDAIDNERISLDSKTEIDTITQSISIIDQKYYELLDTQKYDLAIQTIDHLEKGTAVGKTIDAIFAIGEVTLESEDVIAKAKEYYDALSDEEKKEVTNYALLLPAIERIDQLEQEKAAKEEEERKAQEAAAKEAEEKRQAEEAEKAEAAQRAAEEEERKQAFYNSTVWVTGDKCYHTESCYTVDYSNAWTETRIKAHNEGYVPCSKCYPDSGWGVFW